MKKLLTVELTLFAAFCLIAAELGEGWLLSFRAEMILRVLFLALIFVLAPALPRLAASRLIIVMLGIFFIFQSGFSFDEKSSSRAIIAMFLIAFIFSHTKVKFLLFGVFVLLGATHAYSLNSRTLLLVIALSIVQSVFREKDRSFLLIIFFPAVFILALNAIGYLYLDSVTILHESRSNVARSTMLYAVFSNALNFPLGYPSLTEYDANITFVAKALFNADYIDPHNVLATAISWGGIPLLLATYLAFWGLIRWRILFSSLDYFDVFLLSAVSVMISVMTYSSINFLFLAFLVLTIIYRARASVQTYTPTSQNSHGARLRRRRN